jgi:hypothetical protein
MPRWLLLCITIRISFIYIQVKKHDNLFSKKQREHAELFGCKGEKRKKRGSETYEDNESSKECIDYMGGRNFELPKEKQ